MHYNVPKFVFSVFLFVCLFVCFNDNLLVCFVLFVLWRCQFSPRMTNNITIPSDVSGAANVFSLNSPAC